MVDHTQLLGPDDTYAIQSKLGEGGFGETFLAARESDGLVVVVKRLRMDRLDDWKALELFERESSVLSTLEHPNIPRYVDAFEAPDGSGLVLVQEYIEGRTLRDVLRAGEELDEAEMTRWFLTILEVCAYLHSFEPPVIHRDVNPNNIILRADMEPFLIDFGTVQAAMRSDSTVSSTSAGTFGYAPTEQFIGKAYPSSDLYGLAMTFLAVWTQTEPEEMPFTSGAVQLDALLAHRPLDGRLKLALERMIDRVPENRPGSAAEVLRRLSPLRIMRTSPAPVQRAAETGPNLWVEAKARLGRLDPDSLFGDVAPERRRDALLTNWAISSDGTEMMLATDRAGTLLDTETMSIRKTLPGIDHNDSLAFAPDKSFIIAFNGWDECMKRFDLTAGGEAETFELPPDLQSSDYCGPDAPIAISPDNKMGAIGSPLALFSPESGQLIRLTDVQSEAPPSFSPDGRTLVGVGDPMVSMMGTDGSRTEVHGTCFAFSPDGRKAALATKDSVRVLVGDFERLAGGASKWFDRSYELPGLEEGTIRQLCFDPTARWLAVGVEVRYTPPGKSDWSWANRVVVIDRETHEIVSNLGDPSRGGAFDKLHDLAFDSKSERLFVFSECFSTLQDQSDEMAVRIHDFKRDRTLAFVDAQGIRTPEGFFTPLLGQSPRRPNKDPFESLAWRAACGEHPESVLVGDELERFLDLRQRVEFIQGLFADTDTPGGVALACESDARPLLDATRGLTHLLPWIVQQAEREAAKTPAFGASSDEAVSVSVEHLLTVANALAARTSSERDALFEEMLEAAERAAIARAEAIERRETSERAAWLVANSPPPSERTEILDNRRQHIGELTAGCSCGNIGGVVDVSRALRLTCCCDDCQAYANHLSHPSIPDEYGGSEVTQVPCSALNITSGFEHVRGLRLTPRGMFRWYAGCCDTPIGNTMGSNVPFVGIHAAFFADRSALDAAVGPSRGYTQVRWATKPIPANLNPQRFPLRIIIRATTNLLSWKLTGRGTPSPFFDEAGSPLAPIEILRP